MTTSQYKIALIVPYFGPLPPYFPAWLNSAKANPDVDFLFYTDQDVQIDAPNFRVTKTTLDAMRERFERILNRPVSLPKGYKLCDYKIAYGLFFEEELRGYDFWGYCDVDLMFGRIRHFLTDEVLSAYDRFYVSGHLNVYRNNEKMRRVFELPGAPNTLDVMFGPININADEDGMFWICLKNGIPWYTKKDFANLNPKYKTRLEMDSKPRNYPVQIFYYLDGRAFHRYVHENVIEEEELCYIHWLQRRPVLERPARPGEAVIVTYDKLLVRPPEDLTPENMLRWNPPISRARKVLYKLKCRAFDFRSFFTGSFAFKKIWLKKKFFRQLARLKRIP